MIDPKQFVERVIRPVLIQAGLYAPWAERLVLGTALVESGLTWLAQTPRGPALGVYQMEPATHDDIWKNYLAYKPRLNAAARRWSAASSVPGMTRPDAAELVGNLNYATVMCRLHYLRAAGRYVTPSIDSPVAMARVWKLTYNTPLGAGREEHFVRRLEAFPVDMFAPYPSANS